MNDSGWKAPDDALVKNALSRIGDVQHRRVFFERLDNPLWVRALIRHGIFAAPPETRVDAQGREFWQPWPEGEYLVRMAPDVPEDVTEAVLAATHSSSAVVRGLVLRAALVLPGAMAVRLLPSIEQYLADHSLYDGPEIVALMEHLAAEGQVKPTLRLAKAAFIPRRIEEGEVSARHRRKDVTAGVEPYWFGELMPKVVSVLTTVQKERALSTLTAWLNAYLVASEQFVEGPDGHDLSYIWRPSISPHEQNHGYEDYGDQLVDAVRDVSVSQLANGRPVSDVLTTLERSKQPLLQRIGLHALSTRVSVDSEALTEASIRLLDIALFESEYRHEYAELASAALPHLPESDRNSWTALVLDGPPHSDDDLRERAQHRQMEGEAIEDTVQRVREYWQLQMLSGVDTAALPPAAGARRAVLEAEHGPMDHPTITSFTTSWVGPTSPLEADELNALTPNELLDFLRTWVPDSTGPWSASKEGLARSFQARVRSEPDSFLASAERFSDFDPTYMSALFGGLREALQDERSFNWAAAIEIGAAVALRDDDGSEPEGNRGEDVVWRFAQRAYASLIETGVGREGTWALPPDQLYRAVSSLAPLVDHSDPTPEHEARYGGSNMDPLTLSLNTTRPAVLRALLRIGSKARDQYGTDTEESARSVVSAVLELAGSRLTPHRDPSLAEAAAFGEGLGRLVWMDKEWVAAHEDSLLSPDRFGDVVLTAGLATYRPTTGFLDAIRPAAKRLLTRNRGGEEIALGWRNDRTPVELLGDHLVLLLVWGAIEPDDEVATGFFNLASAASISRVLGHLGWLFGRSDNPVPNDILERARDLWDRRAAFVRDGEADLSELGEFFWWARSGQFDVDWWLPRLEQAAEAADFDARGMIGEQLEQAAIRFPALTIRVLDRLLSQRDEPFGRYDLVEHAPAIIAAALDSGDAAAVETSERVMNDLGRGGHLKIKNLVQQHQDRQQ